MTDFQITATDHGDAATLNGGDPVEILVTIPASGGGGSAVDSVNGETGVVVLSATDVGAQPVDSDLTAIAALTTTTFGRSLLALADAAAIRTSAGLGTAATQATSAFDAAGAASAAQAASQPLDSDLTAIAALTTTSFGRSLLTAADAAAARVLTGAGTSSLALGTSSSTAKAGDYQPVAANISDATTIGKTVLTAADAAAVRSAIGAGTSSFDGAYSSLTGRPTLGTAAAAATGDFDAAGAAAAAQAASQPLDSDLTAIAALATTTFGRSLLTAADAAGARSTLGAGTSSLALGTSSSTAKAGDYQPASTNISDATTVGKALIVAANAGAGRTALALGTSATVDTGTSSGNIPLLSTGGVLPIARLATGTPDGTKFVRDDGTLVTPSGGGGGGTRTLNAQSTSYTAVLGDASTVVVMSNSTSATVTIPTNASVAFADGTELEIALTGVGPLIIAGASGVTISSYASIKLIRPGDTVKLIKVGTNAWAAIGGWLPVYASVVLADTPLAFYRFTESSGTSMADLSGNGHTGTYSATKTAQAGLLNDDSDGATAQYASVTSASWMNVNSIAIECLLKATADPTNSGIAARFNASNDWLLWFDTGGKLAVRFYNASASSVDIAWATAPTLGVTYHVWAQYTSGAASLWINGQLVGFSSALTGNLAQGSTDLDIRSYQGSGHNAPIVLDELAIYGSGNFNPRRIALHSQAA